ncbi:hypothetical protein Tco_1563210 [Tanacetum coccineum]
MQEVDSDLESMPDDEILFVSGFEEANDNDSENVKELSVVDEPTADNVIDELVDMANTQDANLNISAAKATDSNPLGYLQADITSLTAQVNLLESSMSQQVGDKTDDSVPKIVVDAFEERIPELLSNTLKSILLQLIKDSVKKSEVECKASDAAYLILRKMTHSIVQIPRDILFINAKQGDQQTNNSTAEAATAEEVPTNAQGEQMLSALVIHSSDEEPPTKKFKVVLEDYPIPYLTPLNSVRPAVIDNIPYEQFTANLFSSGSSKFYHTPPLKVSDKGKGIA